MDGAGYELLPIIVCLSEITVIQYVKIIGPNLGGCWEGGGTISNMLMEKVKSKKKGVGKINSELKALFPIKDII